MSERKRMIITAGGTKEPIDGVRFITNFSTGRFGHALAQAAIEQDYCVTVMAPKEVPILAGGKIENVEYIPFSDTESLKVALLSQPPTDVVFHAAAVSDYRSSQVVEGKISSEQQSLQINLERTPKILPLLRGHFGEDSFIVGFKLLKGVSLKELIDVAHKQNIKADLNLTVANDLVELDEINHPVSLVNPLGRYVQFRGERLLVARRVMDFVGREL